MKKKSSEISLRFLTWDFGNPAFRGLASSFHTLEIILATLITVFQKMIIENTTRSSGIIAIEVSERKLQEERSDKQRHKEFLTNSIYSFNNVTNYRIKHTFQNGLKG